MSDYYSNDNHNYAPPPLPPEGSKGKAIAAMVLGIVSVVFSCCVYYIALPCGVVGLILGIVSLKKNEPGRGMAIAGIATSSVAIVLALLLLVFSAFILSVFPWGDFLEAFEMYL
jgi:hypothetical protein